MEDKTNMVLIGGHPYPIPALSTAYLQLLLGTNPLHGAPTPLYGYYSNFKMNSIKCHPSYYAIMIIYVTWEKENKIFYSISKIGLSILIQQNIWTDPGNI